MTHHTSADFWDCYKELPEDIQGFLAQAAAAVKEIPSVQRRADCLSG